MLKRWNLMLLTLLAVLALGLAACGDDDDGGSTEEPTDSGEATATQDGGETTDATDGASPADDASSGENVCYLVSEALAAEVLGSDVTEMTGSPETCSYISEQFGSLSISLNDLGPDAEALFSQSREFLSGEDLPGVGDEAFLLLEFKQMYARVGSQQFFATLQFADGDGGEREGLIEVAKEAIANIE